MLALERQLLVGELPRSHKVDVRRAQLREFGEQRFQGAPGVARLVAEAIVRLEATIGTLRQDDARPGNPVGFFPVHKMADDGERAEGVGTLGATGPALPHPVEQGVEDGRGALQNRNRLCQRQIQNSSPFRYWQLLRAATSSSAGPSCST